MPKAARRHENTPDEKDVAELFEAALADAGIIIKFEVWFEKDYGTVTARGYAPGNIRRAGAIYEETVKFVRVQGHDATWASYHAGLKVYVKAQAAVERTLRTMPA